MHLRRLIGLIAIALIAIATMPAAAETPAEKAAAAALDGLLKAGEPGFAVLVARDGKILFENGYGLADREHHVPVTPRTIFRIGSITKQFTASAILKLQDEGKLSVDDKLSKYFPEFPRANEVTLRQLLNHTSGIHDLTVADVPDALNRLAKPITMADLVEQIAKFDYYFDPGTKWRYDNSGYTLLGYVVEKASGQRLGDFLRETFFQPLGMADTGVYRAHLDLPSEALGYTLGARGFEQPIYIDPSWDGGDGAIYSTVEDLYRWNEAIFNGRVLNAASLKAAFTPVPTKASQLNSGYGYGFGWFVRSYRGLREISHGGEVPGFTSMLLRLPNEQVTVVVLANAEGRSNAMPNRLAYQLVDIFLADKLTPPSTIHTNGSPIPARP